jgi:hypothetical protein
VPGRLSNHSKERFRRLADKVILEAPEALFRGIVSSTTLSAITISAPRRYGDLMYKDKYIVVSSITLSSICSVTLSAITLSARLADKVLLDATIHVFLYIRSCHYMCPYTA